MTTTDTAGTSASHTERDRALSAIIEADGWEGVEVAHLMSRAADAIAWGLLDATSDTADALPSDEAHSEAFATARRLLAARSEPEGTMRVDYVVDWMSNGPHPTRWTSQRSTWDTLEAARDFATWKHVHHPKITRRTTFTRVEPVDLVDPSLVVEKTQP